MEIGKINNIPNNSKNEINIYNNMLISSEYAKQGFLVDSFSFYSNLPIFSIVKNKAGIFAGTGTEPYIINILKSDTIAKFSDGEIVYNMVSLKNNEILASIQPSSIIVKISKNKIDTIFNFEKQSINILKKVNNKIFLAVENKLYEYKNNKFDLITTIKDKNITFITSINNTIYLGTEGEGKIVSIKKNKKHLIHSYKNSEIDFIYKKNNDYYFLINTLDKSKEDFNYHSFFIKYSDGIEDTIYKDNEMLLGGEMNSKGIFLFSSNNNILFYDFNNLFNMGYVPSDYILRFKNIKNSIFITTGDPGKIYEIKNQYSDKAFISGVMDFSKRIIINSIYINSEEKGKLYLRLGNTVDIDTSWTDFMLINTNKNEEFSEYRFAQYKYVFKDNNDKLYSVDFYYKTKNHKPIIKDVKVFPPRILPDYMQNNNMFTYSLRNIDMYPEFKDQNLLKTDKKIIFVNWNAYDIDNDMLTYDVFLENRDGLYPVKRDFLDNHVLIYTDVFDEGVYNLKIIAYDSLSNSKNAMNSEFIKKRILIDNTPPEIMNVSFKLNHLYFTSHDKKSFINEIYYSINGSEFKEAKPIDDIFDSKTEEFNIEIKREKNEKLLIMIYAIDEYGNIGKYKKIVK